jgi:hypothetical protein
MLVINLWATSQDHKTYTMVVVVVVAEEEDLTRSRFIHADTSIWIYGWLLQKRFAYLQQEG